MKNEKTQERGRRGRRKPWVRIGKSRDYRGDFGRASVVAACGSCGEDMTVYVQSFAGCGKRCPSCGVLNANNGPTGPFSKPEVVL